MQLGDPTVLETSSGEAVAHEGANGGREVIGVDANSGEEDKVIREEGIGGHGDEVDNKINCGGNRWPRQETLALLKIRSDMDAVFRDSSLKGPLWDEVSRKLAELGYHRSAKKCKEKFENVYKYHKRTKESRSGKPEGKTYRFFDQLQALENQFTVSCYPPKPQPQLQTQPTMSTNNTVALPTRPSDTTTISYVTTTVLSTNPTVISPSPPLPINATTTITSPNTVVTNPRNPSQANNNNNVPYSLPNMNLFSTTTSTSSSTASDEDLEEKYRKKRKWKDHFRRLTRQVLVKQKEMQKKFLEAIDKRQREHVAQQDAWRMQEMARINREHELLVQERTTAAAKDAAVVAFLQKLSDQQIPTAPSAAIAGGNFIQQLPTPPPLSQVKPQQQQQQQMQQPPLIPNYNLEIQKVNNGHNHSSGAPLSSSSRWPKAEVHALIRLRKSLEAKYQENGPKAPLWEDISAGMQRLGYSRSAKRCKEKWENINKYFKKVKESKRQRREDSKTCPYFNELDALYKEKGKSQNLFGGASSFQHNMKPNEMMEPLMVQPEQQWRPPPQYEQHEMKEKGEEAEEEEDDDDDDEGEVDGESMEDEGGSRYETATNKLPSVDTVE